MGDPHSDYKQHVSHSENRTGVPKPLRRDVHATNDAIHIHSGKDFSWEECRNFCPPWIRMDELYTINDNPCLYVGNEFDERPHVFIGGKHNGSYFSPYTMSGRFDNLIPISPIAFVTPDAHVRPWLREFGLPSAHLDFEPIPICEGHPMLREVFTRLAENHFFGMYFQPAASERETVLLGNLMMGSQTSPLPQQFL